MKILVAIKQVPATATQMKVAAGGKAIDTAGITWIVSPYEIGRASCRERV